MASLATGSVNFPTHVYSNSTEMVEKLAASDAQIQQAHIQYHLRHHN